MVVTLLDSFEQPLQENTVTIIKNMTNKTTKEKPLLLMLSISYLPIIVFKFVVNKGYWI